MRHAVTARGGACPSPLNFFVCIHPSFQAFRCVPLGVCSDPESRAIRSMDYHGYRRGGSLRIAIQLGFAFCFPTKSGLCYALYASRLRHLAASDRWGTLLAPTAVLFFQARAGIYTARGVHCSGSMPGQRQNVFCASPCLVMLQCTPPLWLRLWLYCRCIAPLCSFCAIHHRTSGGTKRTGFIPVRVDSTASYLV